MFSCETAGMFSVSTATAGKCLFVFLNKGSKAATIKEPHAMVLQTFSRFYE